MLEVKPGEAVSALRKERGWSQAQLAEELGLKSKGYISDIERTGTISRPVAIALFKRFHLKLPPIDCLTDAEIDVLARVLPAR